MVMLEGSALRSTSVVVHITNVEFEILEEYRDIEMKSFFEEKVEAGEDPAVAQSLLRP